MSKPQAYGTDLKLFMWRRVGLTALIIASGCGDSGGTGDESLPLGGAGGVAAAGGIGGTGGVAGTAGTSSMSGGAAGAGGAAAIGGAGGVSGAPGGSGGMNAGAGGTTGGAGGTAGSGDTTVGCEDGVRLLPLPENPGERGPWKVGVRTVKIGRLTVEVVYPAKPGSTDGLEEAFYDMRTWLPVDPSIGLDERAKIPDEASPDVKPIGGELFRDMPIDDEHGPYPVVVHVHGTSSIRIASGSIMVHWASHGFIVLAADHPGLVLQDQIAPGCPGLAQTGEQDLDADVRAELAALGSPSGELAFLGDRVDATRVAINGHSQGGCAAAMMGSLPGVQMVIPFSGSYPTDPSANLKSIFYVGGTADTVIAFDGLGAIGNWVCPPGSTTTKLAYDASPGPPSVKKRLLGIQNGGHLAPTDLCQTNDLGKGALEEMVERDVCGWENAAIIGLPAIFDCGPEGSKVKHIESVPPINYATTAALEETLLCQDRTAAFSQLKTLYPIVGVFEENL